MTGVQPLSDTTELVELLKPLGLYLKPIARMNISVQLPLLKEPGKSISNWDLMEKLKKMVRPHQFTSIKVSKSTLEFVRFEAELENRQLIEAFTNILDNSVIKLIGFFEALKVRAAEAKIPFPARHDWDSFFRDAKHMHEMKPGERPDTVFFGDLPCRWFLDANLERKPGEKIEPSEFVFKRVFGTFGDIRCVDIPMCDPYRAQMTGKGVGTIPTFNFGGDLLFDGYIQFVEYIGFVKCMDALRGMKLVRIDPDGKAAASNIKVDFDTTKHLADKNIRRRRLERERIMQEQFEEQERLRKEQESLSLRLDEEQKQKLLQEMTHKAAKLERRREREEKRRLKHIERKKKTEEERFEHKILVEERKLLLAQRKLESMRLLTELFKRVQGTQQKEDLRRQLSELEEATEKEASEREMLEQEERERRARLLGKREEQLRSKVIENYKAHNDSKLNAIRDVRLKEITTAGTTKLRSIAQPVESRARSRSPVETKGAGSSPTGRRRSASPSVAVVAGS